MEKNNTAAAATAVALVAAPVGEAGRRQETEAGRS